VFQLGPPNKYHTHLNTCHTDVGTLDFAVIANSAFWMVRLANVAESFVPGHNFRFAVIHPHSPRKRFTSVTVH
jgi:hypothetical protein